MSATSSALNPALLTENYLKTSGSSLWPYYEKVMAGERLTREEAIAIYNSSDLLGIGALADAARRRQMPPDTQNYVYWVHNFHINPTNICEDHCSFCSFKKGPKSPHAYVQTVEQVIHNVRRYPGHASLKEFHIVAGHYREMTLAFYCELFQALRREFPNVGIKALTAAEIDYIAKIDGLSHEAVLKALIESGLQAMPGGGAEVFSPRVRALVCPDKISGETWCHIHGLAHQLGVKSNATMLAGLGETAEERVDHMLALRAQQDATGGFLSFIPLNCYYEGNKIDPRHALTGVENLKNFAVARLVLDNFSHIKSFWIHIGEKISQVGLSFGVSDIDGTVVEEKIAHAAGTDSAEVLTKEQLIHLVRRAGKIPVERDMLYNIVQVYGPETATVS
ncbi:MAG: CofH family radical SAM protein [Candidatus Melainabacteria bacterium]|nr:CofH family radical SAM protein [Candidatus Melainabacteria bacterium]